MPNEENLKRGKATQFSGELAAKAQRKSAASRKRNNSIRKLGQQMLQTPLDISGMADGPETLAALKGFGFETDEPELQMLILARVASMALSTNPKVALAATDMLMDITGNDVRSQIAHEQRRMDRERLKLEREKFEMQYKSQEQSSLEKLDALIADIDSAARADSPAPSKGSEDAAES